MATKKQNPVMQSIVNTSQGAKVKITSSKPSLTNQDILDLAVQAGNAVVGVGDAQALLTSTSEVLDKVIANLKNGGFKPLDLRSKEGKGPQGEQTRIFKTAFIDSVIEAGKTDKTASIYYDAVILALKTGKPVNLNPAKKSGGAKKSGEDKSPVAIVDLLAKVYNHLDYEKTLSENTRKEIEAILVAKKYL